jgi:hypothetical protein
LPFEVVLEDVEQVVQVDLAERAFDVVVTGGVHR